MWNYRHLGDSQGQSEKQIYHTGQNLVFNQYTDWKDRNEKPGMLHLKFRGSVRKEDIPTERNRTNSRMIRDCVV